jgi:hypothetical protein
VILPRDAPPRNWQECEISLTAERSRQRLRTDPLVFGEAQYRFSPISGPAAAVAPLVMDYAVPEKQPFVFFRGFKLLT